MRSNFAYESFTVLGSLYRELLKEMIHDLHHVALDMKQTLVFHVAANDRNIQGQFFFRGLSSLLNMRATVGLKQERRIL
jgi:hypothetical protein